MVDIVERLRKRIDGAIVEMSFEDVVSAEEAADEIERLREALQKIVEYPSYKVTSTIIHLKMIAETALKEKE